MSNSESIVVESPAISEQISSSSSVISSKPFLYHDDKLELTKHVARMGVPGVWTKQQTNNDNNDEYLVFETNHSTIKASLKFHEGTRQIEFFGDDVLREKFTRSSMRYEDPMCNLERLELPDRIMEHLYLGAHQSALNLEGLKERNITHIITAGKGLKMGYPHLFKYKFIDILDWEGEDIAQYFDGCMEFIEEGRNTGAVLVHCAAGVSRSATITIAYLMFSCEYSFSDARDFVSSKRWIYPNNGFVRQLIRYEKLLTENRKAAKKLRKQLEEKEALSSLL